MTHSEAIGIRESLPINTKFFQDYWNVDNDIFTGEGYWYLAYSNPSNKIEDWDADTFEKEKEYVRLYFQLNDDAPGEITDMEGIDFEDAKDIINNQ